MSAVDAKHKGFAYFITGTPDDRYKWERVNAAGDTVCMSEKFSDRRDGLKMLRAAQRHAATTHVVDHSAK